MKIAIPKENPDLIRATRGKLIRQIALCAIWTAAVAAFMLLYGFGYFKRTASEYDPSVGFGTAVAVWVILTAIPFLRYQCWRWFTDRSFEGKVISSKQTHHMTMKSAIDREKIRLYKQNLVIRLTDGEEKAFKLTWKDGDDCPYYYEGDYVRYYRGTKYPMVLSDDPNAPKLCVMCGTANRPDDQTCSICRHSLIDRRLTQEGENTPSD